MKKMNLILIILFIAGTHTAYAQVSIESLHGDERYSMQFLSVKVSPGRIFMPLFIFAIVQFSISPWHPTICGTGETTMHI